MSGRDLEQPYMIYEGPRPAPPAPAEPIPVDAAEAEESWGEEEPGRGWGTIFGVGLLVAGTLAAGIAIGVWFAPTLGPTPRVASVEPTAPLALTITRPAETPAPATIEVPPPPPPTPQAVSPELQTSVRTVPPATMPQARAAAARPVKAAASQPAEALGGCNANGSRVQMALCADASIATADRDMRNAFQRALRVTASPASLRADQEDWLAFREEAARRSPAELAEAYRHRIAELNEFGDEPPH